MPTPPLNKFVRIDPPVPLGEDTPIDLTCATDPTGWAVAAYGSTSPTGPQQTMSGLSAAVVGGVTNVIRVTLTAALTAAQTIDATTGEGKVYVEVWRTDSGNTRCLRRLMVPVYDPIRDE